MAAYRAWMCWGSIPACAGETFRFASAPCTVTVDPRVRGGDDIPASGQRPCKGRSPRARGRRAAKAIGISSVRSIPACAGETVDGQTLSLAMRVDPRVRGGDRSTKSGCKRSSGRSPRARGRQPSVFIWSSPERSIPACAGETLRSCFGRRFPRVDPRVRGGDRRLDDAVLDEVGRSPRARGRPTLSWKPPTLPGSIPACAGETCHP